MFFFLCLSYTDIPTSCYSSDRKILNEVNDQSPHLKIFAECEIIQNSCFSRLDSLLSFTFYENPSLRIIGNYAFSGCKGLTIVNLSMCSMLETISIEAFAYCKNVTEILLPNSLQEILNSAFSSCEKISNVTIPASVRKIGSNAFSSCSTFKNVTFEPGSNLETLENAVFWNTNVLSFEIPENVSNISGTALSRGRITNLQIHPNNNHLKFKDNIIFSANYSILFFVFDSHIESYEIPDSVNILGDYCFYYLHIKSITIPNSVTTLKDGCFEYTEISTITIPESVKRIEYHALTSIRELKNITFLGPIDYFENSIIKNCPSLELIIFPNSPMIVNSDSFSPSDSP